MGIRYDHSNLRKKAASRWEVLARCFAARRLPKSELSTVVLPHVTQSFPRGVPRELTEISLFVDRAPTPAVSQSPDTVDFALLQELGGGEAAGAVEETEEDFHIEED